MARNPLLLADDGSPITIGDSGPTREYVKKFLRDPKSPYIGIAHPCFSEMLGVLGLHNTEKVALSVDVRGGKPYPLEAPWTLFLNGLEVVLHSRDGKIIRIQVAEEYDMKAALTGDVKNPVTIQLLIGESVLRSAALWSGGKFTEIDLGRNKEKYLEIKFPPDARKKKPKKKAAPVKKKTTSPEPS